MPLLYKSKILAIFFSFAFIHYAKADNSKPAKTVPFFRNGEAQKVRGFGDRKEWIKHELWVETTFDSDNDGILDRMHVMVTRPYQTDSEDLKLPVIYKTSPYFSGIAKNRKRYHWDPKTELGTIPQPHKHPRVKQKSRRNWIMFANDIQWVTRGYIMVYSSSPGTGLSDGSPTIGGSNESLAPKAVIDWLCGRAKGYLNRTGQEEVLAYWCNSNIGMIGTSYNGTLALAAATTGVDGLKAIIPIAPVTNWYSYYRSNGLVRSPGGYIGEDMDVLFDGIHSGDKKNRKSNSERVRDSILVPGQDRVTGDYNSFWESRNYLLQMNKMKAAMLMGHSFDDWNVMLNHSVDAYLVAKKLGLPVKLYLRPGGHGASPPFELMNLWFTKYLHEHENDVDKKTDVMILREGYSLAAGYSNFPDKKSEMVKLFLGDNGSETGSLSHVSFSNSSSASFVDDYSFSPKQLAGASSSLNRLVYASDTIKNEIRISGYPEVRVRLKSNKASVNLSVYLLEYGIGEKGNSFHSVITRGWADPQNHASIENSEPLDTSKFYTIDFKLIPTDYIIEQGKRIGIMIFSSDNKYTLRPEPGTEIKIDLQKTVLDLPVVGGEQFFLESTNTKN